MTLSNSSPVGAGSSVAKSKELHEGDDVDVNGMAHHHTLGWGTNQAAPGAETLKRLAESNAGKPKISCVPPGTQSFTAGVYSKLLWTAEFQDRINLASGVFTITVAGYYRMFVRSGFIVQTNQTSITILVNGVRVATATDFNGAANAVTVAVEKIKQLAVNDTVEFQLSENNGAQSNNITNGYTACSIETIS